MGVAEIGKDACAEVEPALKPIFASLTSMSEAPKTGDAQLILIPTFADSGATAGRTAFSTRELVVYLQWTAKDKSGKTVWVETVQGSAKHRVGSLFTYNKNLKLIVGDTIRDVAAQSAICGCDFITRSTS